MDNPLWLRFVDTRLPNGWIRTKLVCITDARDCIRQECTPGQIIVHLDTQVVEREIPSRKRIVRTLYQSIVDVGKRSECRPDGFYPVCFPTLSCSCRLPMKLST